MASTPTSQATTPVRAAIASFVGGMLEYYDFFVYGTAAALVLNKLFFAGLSPALGTVAAFATFAIGYVVRPLGGIVFGHVADHLGRKRSLIATLLVMGVSTVLIGVLPTYSSIGAAAPMLLLLLRLIQGFGLGGELGVASVFAVEHAPPGRRGFFGAFAYSGPFAGLVLSTGVFGLLSLMPADAFASWGWRVPFLFSVVVVAVALIVRLGVPEPTVLRTAGDEVTKPRVPVVEALRGHSKDVLAVALISAAPNTIFYIVTVFSLSYATTAHGVPQTTMLTIVTLAAVFLFTATPLWGGLSDRIGRKKPIILGTIAEGALLFVFFLGLETSNTLVIFATTVLVLGLGHAVVNGVVPAFFCELFPTHIRASAVSLGQQLGGVMGGIAPLVAATLIGANWGGWLPLAAYGVVLCALGVSATFVALHRWDRSIVSSHPAAAVQS
ncbi:MFS transporter [Saccharopolyspora pogona]|uniref:MFS transporter n=1 Tax=Saccharopolyspora pogona TaxID=333966 RepID=UPI00168545F2|nr:MFS transporter [Saccharopolyspora pogona]